MPPNVTTITNRVNRVGDTVSLQVSATAGAGGALSYNATGLPTGTSINTSTGLITGIVQPTTTITFSPTITVTEVGNGSAQTTFSWGIKPGVLKDRANVSGASQTALALDIDTSAWTADSSGTPYPSITTNGSTTNPGSATTPAAYHSSVPLSSRIDTIYTDRRADGTSPGPLYNVGGVVTVHSGRKYRIYTLWNTGLDVVGTRLVDIVVNGTTVGTVDARAISNTNNNGVAQSFDVTLASAALTLGFNRAAAATVSSFIYGWEVYEIEELPTISALTDVTVAQGESDTRPLVGADPNGGSVTFSPVGLPDWVTVDGTTLNIDPLSDTEATEYSGYIRATKTNGLYSETPLAITVESSGPTPEQRQRLLAPRQMNPPVRQQTGIRKR
jgi:hypothetical protein